MSSTKETESQLSMLSNYDLSIFYRLTQDEMAKRGLIKVGDRLLHYENRIKSLKIDFDEYINQDWGYLGFAGSIDIEGYYVYLHIDPRTTRFKCGPITGRPFYVGKGFGDRAFCKRRNKPHAALINEIVEDGYSMSDIVFKYRAGLFERDAYQLEAKLINWFGCRSEIPKAKRAYISGMKKGILINTDTSLRPKWIEDYIKLIK